MHIQKHTHTHIDTDKCRHVCSAYSNALCTTHTHTRAPAQEEDCRVGLHAVLVICCVQVQELEAETSRVQSELRRILGETIQETTSLTST